jgi:hypothetical protein
MASLRIEYKDGTKKRINFFAGGEVAAHESALRYLEKEGNLIYYLCTCDLDNNLDESYIWRGKVEYNG